MEFNIFKKVEDSDKSELDIDFCRTIPEFKKIIWTDRGCDGDADGRKKHYSTRVFWYIYYTCEFMEKNPCVYLPDEQRHNKAIELSGLPPDWKADSVVKDAMKAYKDYQVEMSPVVKLLLNLQRGLNVSNDVVETVINRMNSQLTKIKKATELDSPILDSDIDSLVTNVGTLISLSDKARDAQAIVEKTLLAVKKEKANIKYMKNGEAVPNRADPKSKKVIRIGTS